MGKGRRVSIAILAMLAASVAACTMDGGPVPPLRPAGGEFCDLPDARIRPYVVSVEVAGWTAASGVATVLDGRLYVLTNRHNLPPEPNIALVNLRNHAGRSTVARAIVAVGEDYAKEGGLAYARDFAVLSVADSSLFQPLPLHDGRYQGPVVVPNFAERHYSVGRGSQTGQGELFDRLNLALGHGSSGAPVITCQGTIAGLYTAMIRATDWDRTGFKGVATPIGRVATAVAENH